MSLRKLIWSWETIIKSNNLPRYKSAREIRKYLWGITDVPKDIIVYTQEEINEGKQKAS
jgi:hypothetical protein